MLLNQQGLAQAIFIAAGIILIALGLLAFRRRAAFAGSAWQRMLGAAILIVVLTITGFMRVGHAVVDDPWNQRYVYIQQLLFLIALCILLARNLAWQRWPPRWRAGVVVLMLTYITALHWHVGGHFKSEVHEGRRLAEFLRTLDEKKDLPRHRRPATLVLHKNPPKWSIRIKLKPPQSRH